MIVEEMKVEDVKAIASMEQEIFSDGWSEKTIENTQLLEHTYVAVAREKQDVVGYFVLYLTGDTADLARIAVLADLRRGGVARKLLAHMEAYVQQKAVERVLLEVRTSNHAAIGLYKQFGFLEIGKRKNYYKDPVEDGIVMEKQLVISTSYSTKKQI